MYLLIVGVLFVSTEIYNTSKVEACYKMDGTTTNPKWHVENCTLQQYNLYNDSYIHKLCMLVLDFY